MGVIRPDRPLLPLPPVRRTPAAVEAPLKQVGRGAKREAKALVLAPFQHPVAVLASVAACAALVLAAPLVGVSALAAGNLLLVAFAGLALWHAARAWATHDYEALGAGLVDLGATVGPGLVGRVGSVAARTQAGRFAGRWFAATPVGRALPELPRGPAIAGRAPGRAAAWLNQALDEAPAAAVAGVEGRVITAVNYSPAGIALRDRAIAGIAKQHGTTLEALRARDAERLVVPRLQTAAQDVSAVLARGPVPRTDADMAFLVREKHVKTIVTLLHPGKPEEAALLAAEQALAARHGVKLVNLALPFGVDPPPAMVAAYMAELDAATPGARVYVHCKLGRDRTGTAVALYRHHREGQTGAEAFAEMRAFGFDAAREPYLAYLERYITRLGQAGPAAPTATARQALRVVAPALAASNSM